MHLVGVIQARMGSLRLPGKVMLPLAGKPVIWHVFDRLRRVRQIETVVLATTTDPRNDEMVRFAEAAGMQACRHVEEDDIAGRLALVFSATDADAVLKVNADCPAVDPQIMQAVVDRFLAEPGVDHASNKRPFSWPLGMSAEVISARAIAWCDRHLVSREDRELVASWIMHHPDRFRIASVCSATRYSVGDLMIDTEDEYRAMTRLFDALHRPGEAFGLEEIVSFMTLHRIRHV